MNISSPEHYLTNLISFKWTSAVFQEPFIQNYRGNTVTGQGSQLPSYGWHIWLKQKMLRKQTNDKSCPSKQSQRNKQANKQIQVFRGFWFVCFNFLCSSYRYMIDSINIIANNLIEIFRPSNYNYIKMRQVYKKDFVMVETFLGYKYRHPETLPTRNEPNTSLPSWLSLPSPLSLSSAQFWIATTTPQYHLEVAQYRVFYLTKSLIINILLNYTKISRFGSK